MNCTHLYPVLSETPTQQHRAPNTPPLSFSLEILLMHPSSQLVKYGKRLKGKHPDTIVIAQIIIKNPQVTSSLEFSSNYTSPVADLRLFSVPFHYPPSVTRQPTHSQTIVKQQPQWDGAGSQHTKRWDLCSLLSVTSQGSVSSKHQSQRKKKGMELVQFSRSERPWAAGQHTDWARPAWGVANCSFLCSLGWFGSAVNGWGRQHSPASLPVICQAWSALGAESWTKRAAGKGPCDSSGLWTGAGCFLHVLHSQAPSKNPLIHLTCEEKKRGQVWGSWSQFSDSFSFFQSPSVSVDKHPRFPTLNLTPPSSCPFHNQSAFSSDTIMTRKSCFYIQIGTVLLN